MGIYVYILEVALDTLDKLIHNSQNICGCLILNAMHIKLKFLIICFINLTNTSSTPPPEGKKINTVYSTFSNFDISCTSTETFIYYKFKDKIFDLFKALNQHNCCFTALWKFLEVLISFCVNGVFKCNNLGQ